MRGHLLRPLTLELRTAVVVVVVRTVGALQALHTLSTRTLSSALVAAPSGHSASSVTSTRQAAQGVAPLQGVVPAVASITETTSNVLLRKGGKDIEQGRNEDGTVL